MHIRMASEIWVPRDQHSPGSLPQAKSVEKRAWVRGWTLTCPRGYNSLGQFLELAWIIFTINNVMSVCIFQCPFLDCSCPLLAWWGGWVGKQFRAPYRISLKFRTNWYLRNAPHPFISYGNYFYWLIDVNKDNIVCLLVVGLHLTWYAHVCILHSAWSLMH